MTKHDLEADLHRIKQTLELVQKVVYEPLFATETDVEAMKANVNWLFGEFKEAFVTERLVAHSVLCRCKGITTGCNKCNDTGFYTETRVVPTYSRDYERLAKTRMFQDIKDTLKGLKLD